MNYSTFIKEKLVSLINEMDQYRNLVFAIFYCNELLVFPDIFLRRFGIADAITISAIPAG